MGWASTAQKRKVVEGKSEGMFCLSVEKVIGTLSSKMDVSRLMSYGSTAIINKFVKGKFNAEQDLVVIAELPLCCAPNEVVRRGVPSRLIHYRRLADAIFGP